MMKKSLLIPLLLALSVTIFAADKPDFSGEWVLNVAKSDFGPLPGPTLMTQQIEHKEPALKVRFHSEGMQGSMDGEVAYTTDGAECKNQIGDVDITSTLTWEGVSLKVKSVLDIQGMSIDAEDTWTLSEDGQTITVDRFMSSSMGDAEQTLIMEKQ
ncbi:MAG: hypothetical protein JSU96_08620 [Acidobacteriota bacterium]|nr:MAG: hypothetical protein JSU96_08620 [Acidobacteriota bacterium]